jgi:hypothetical protein
MINRGD